MAEIELKHIGKRFPDGTEAVKDLSLTIGEGEFFILLGPSGCGKSTVLNIIVGLEPPTSGEVRIDGRNMTGMDPKDRNMAMVFQSYAIYPHMSVYDNLAFPLRLAKLEPEEIEHRVREAARTLELESLLERRPASLSGGQRQRVAMGRAMVRKPDAFLLDEPLSNLDAKLRTQMRAEIARLQEQLGTTTVYVTHDQTEAITLGHRLALLRRGSLQQIGTPRELYNRPANLFVAGFIGFPPMNFLPGTVERGKLQLPLLEDAIDLGESAEAKTEQRTEVIVGLRPEHLSLDDGADGRPSLSGTVTMVEWLGADAYVYFDFDGVEELEGFSLPAELEGAAGAGVSAAVRLAPSHRLSRGETLRLQPDYERLHLFDRKNGRRLDFRETDE